MGKNVQTASVTPMDALRLDASCPGRGAGEQRQRRRLIPPPPQGGVTGWGMSVRITDRSARHWKRRNGVMR
jgi:hypothetical protein